MFRKRWYIEVGLIVIVIAMSVLLFFRLERLLDFIRKDRISANQVFETANPTLVIPPTDQKVSGGNVSGTQVGVIQIEPTEAPDFELKSLSGGLVSLSDFRGKPVLINFWATWCPPCRVEMPLIQEFADRYSEDLVVLAINAGEDEIDVQYFVEEHGYDLIFLLDPPNSVANLYRIRGFPTSLFIDEVGDLRVVHIGEMDDTIIRTHLAVIGIGE